MDTMKTSLVYGETYRLLRLNGDVIEGEHVQTKGNDGGYPTFRLADGGFLSVASINVLGPRDDSCAVEGIENGYRADALILDDEAEDRRFSGLEGDG